MSRFKDLASKGWHPSNEQSMRQMIRREKPGGYTDIKSANEHSSAPLSTLKDPASFGPPPKHVAIHGENAGPGGNPSASAARGSSQQPAQYKPPAMPSRPAADVSPSPPPAPSRLVQAASPSPAPAAAPSLPPRLPPRQSSPAVSPSIDAATSQGDGGDQYINTQAAGRLANAGVSVPGFNIGGSYAQGGAQSRSPPPRQPAAPSSAGQMDELQSRFARLGKATPSAQADSPAQASGTSWAQKQSALRTADSFRRDPSSVSLADARDAASTAHSFQQRHGQQIASGVKTADAAAAAAAKKPKPPPPKKKPELSAGPSMEQPAPGAPPPIPLSSKPR